MFGSSSVACGLRCEAVRGHVCQMVRTNLSPFPRATDHRQPPTRTRCLIKVTHWSLSREVFTEHKSRELSGRRKRVKEECGTLRVGGGKGKKTGGDETLRGEYRVQKGGQHAELPNPGGLPGRSDNHVSEVVVGGRFLTTAAVIPVLREPRQQFRTARPTLPPRPWPEVVSGRWSGNKHNGAHLFG